MLRVIFSHVTGAYVFPLATEDIAGIVHRFFPTIAPRIRLVRFVCSNHARTLARVMDGNYGATITVNFATIHGTSRLQSRQPKYLKEIETCGGCPNVELGRVTWSEAAAQRYAFLLLAHEIGHLAYAKHMTGGHITEGRGGGSEEKWCSAFALDALKRFQAMSDPREK